MRLHLYRLVNKGWPNAIVMCRVSVIQDTQNSCQLETILCHHCFIQQRDITLIAKYLDHISKSDLKRTAIITPELMLTCINPRHY